MGTKYQEISREKNNWKIVTSKDKIFIAPNIIIAGGVGSFEPNKFSRLSCQITVTDELDGMVVKMPSKQA